jgi:hypothetical protein
MLQGRVGVKPEFIEIRDLEFSWGSCTENGKLFSLAIDPLTAGAD